MISVEDWAEIHRLYRAQSLSISEIARQLGVTRNTVRSALASDRPPKYQTKTAAHPRRYGRAAGAGIVAEVPSDAGDGDRRADRVAAFDIHDQGLYS